MRRSYEYQTKNQNGSDYYSHVHKMERAPSLLTEVPHYPQGQAFLNNHAGLREDYGQYEHQQKQHNHADYGGYYEHEKRQHSPEVQKSVEVTERVTECDKNGNCVVFEKTVDVAADGHIHQKDKGFELFKWKTFKSRLGMG